ncbi:hypothetical protein QQY66_20845 [Streptomyces sp. DG2A-72]|uniref:hypothetical protein n=1 Tax=Streptomyces sp. DG2A-72 TaxID=3051386 RepID=UPI00265C1AB5|nr:hypothetical protein [Streptomyces sp. DG2A-72]MDO0934015.1 hypothetical protein [Streptomyces sp. DG2A-72]
MTQSGQGEEPSPRQAREGIVLPSDGGEPLLPGMTNGQGGPQYGRPVPPTPAPAPAAAPPEGQAWGTPWGPDQHQPPPPPQGQGWDSGPTEPWGSPEPYQQQAPAAWGTPDQANAIPAQPQPRQEAAYGGEALPGPGAQPTYAPQEPAPQQSYTSHAQAPQMPGAQQPSYTSQAPSAESSYTSHAPNGQSPSGSQGRHAAGGALPPAEAGGYGAASPSGSVQPPTPGYGPPAAAQPQPPTAADGYGGPAPGAYGSGAAAPLPPAGSGSFGAPLPPADDGATQYIPPVAGGGAPAHALPDGATQYIPPVAGGGAPAHALPDGATQYIPPVAAAPSGPGDEGATQYIPPVGPGALPPEVPAGAAGEETRYLGRAQQNPGPLPPANPDAEATQYIPPVAAGQDRQPLAEFDSLFRSEPRAEHPAAATQQLPRFEPPQAPAHPQPAYVPPGADDHRGRGGRGGRSGSRVPLIAAVGVGIAVLGVGAGALLAGGGGDDQSDDKNQPVSATAPATEGSASPSADVAEQQAIALDKLLADSGDSRATVINAVADVKTCKNMGQAAADLRDAAKQRTGLVTSLSKLSVDKLPNHAALTSALNSAWQASASADNHYAAWADQVAAKKGNLCKKGQARTTGQTAAGNRASGTATAQKAKAAQLWNAIAKTYGLTQRQPTQL